MHKAVVCTHGKDLRDPTLSTFATGRAADAPSMVYHLEALPGFKAAMIMSFVRTSRVYRDPTLLAFLLTLLRMAWLAE